MPGAEQLLGDNVTAKGALDGLAGLGVTTMQRRHVGNDDSGPLLSRVRGVETRPRAWGWSHRDRCVRFEPPRG